ncbi:MAG: hypothetical protein AB1349_12980 [Elusimicrobiota bacterium]
MNFCGKSVKNNCEKSFNKVSENNLGDDGKSFDTPYNEGIDFVFKGVVRRPHDPQGRKSELTEQRTSHPDYWGVRGRLLSVSDKGVMSMRDNHKIVDFSDDTLKNVSHTTPHSCPVIDYSGAGNGWVSPCYRRKMNFNKVNITLTPTLSRQGRGNYRREGIFDNFNYRRKNGKIHFIKHWKTSVLSSNTLQKSDFGYRQKNINFQKQKDAKGQDLYLTNYKSLNLRLGQSVNCQDHEQKYLCNYFRHNQNLDFGELYISHTRYHWNKMCSSSRLFHRRAGSILLHKEVC